MPGPLGLPMSADDFATWVANEREQYEKYPEAVIVRRPDGSTAYYRPEDYAADSEDIIARKYIDGDVRYYAGPDAGPRSDPRAWVHLRDLAGPDGIVTLPNGARLRWAKSTRPEGVPAPSNTVEPSAP